MGVYSGLNRVLQIEFLLNLRYLNSALMNLSILNLTPEQEIQKDDV